MNNPNIRVRVRHNRSLALIAIVVPVSGESLKLVGVEPQDGPLPDVQALIGQVFANRGDLRKAIEARMVSLVGETLEKVVLTESVMRAWMSLATRVAHAAVARGVRPDEIPNERAKPVEGGRLLIWCDIPGQRVELIVGPSDWAWATVARKHPLH